RIIPILYYQDVAAAAEWLVRVFGMRPRNISNTADYHELALGDSVVILQRLETPDSGGGAVSHSLYAYVDNLDQHFARAQAGGARIVSEIQRHGDRSYTAADLAGHPWTFAQARPTQRR
ncbi:MAG TPA: VOC family protein, partial [Bryobacteraceae bacterium]